jgi:hypothetical protein
MLASSETSFSKDAQKTFATKRLRSSGGPKLRAAQAALQLLPASLPSGISAIFT